MSTRLLWHRRDLRLSDNELYHITDSSMQNIYSVFVLDPADYAPRPTGIFDEKGCQLQSINHGPHFSRRLIDAVRSLKSDLQLLGGDLIVRTGNPLMIIPQLAKELQVKEVAWSEVPGYYEYNQSEKLKRILQFDGTYRCHVFTTCSLTLAHPDDLPNDPILWQKLARPNEKQKKSKCGKSNKNDMNRSSGASPHIIDVSPSRFQSMPVIMGDFRRVARASALPRQLFEYPSSERIAKDFTGLDLGEVPSLDELIKPLLETSFAIIGCLPAHLVERIIQSANKIPQHKEHHFMKHLKDFVRSYASRADRNLCDVSNNNSSRLRLPLALGILSPRQVYRCVRDEQMQLEQDGNGNTARDINWLISHMEMRDYFIFNHFRQGKSAYYLHPTHPVHKPNIPREWLPLSEDNKKRFTRWASGETGLPLVDAGMKELITTGYTSNRVRQNMASVLTKDLKLDWRLGAEWYQLCLEDHCVAGKVLVSAKYCHSCC